MNRRYPIRDMLIMGDDDDFLPQIASMLSRLERDGTEEWR